MLRNGHRIISFLISAVLLGSLAGATFARNRIWHDTASLWLNSAEGSAAKRGPDHVAFIFLGAGQKFAGDGQARKAIEQFRKALALKPDLAEAYFDLGLVYGQLEQYDRAIEEFHRVLALDPEYEGVHYAAGLAFAQKGEYDRAVEEFTGAIDADPEFAQIYVNRGLAYARSGKPGPALSDFQKACALGDVQGCEALKKN